MPREYRKKASKSHKQEQKSGRCLPFDTTTTTFSDI